MGTGFEGVIGNCGDGCTTMSMIKHGTVCFKWMKQVVCEIMSQQTVFLKGRKEGRKRGREGGRKESGTTVLSSVEHVGRRRQLGTQVGVCGWGSSAVRSSVGLEMSSAVTGQGVGCSGPSADQMKVNKEPAGDSKGPHRPTDRSPGCVVHPVPHHVRDPSLCTSLYLSGCSESPPSCPAQYNGWLPPSVSLGQAPEPAIEVS